MFLNGNVKFSVGQIGNIVDIGNEVSLRKIRKKGKLDSIG